MILLTYTVVTKELSSSLNSEGMGLLDWLTVTTRSGPEMRREIKCAIS